MLTSPPTSMAWYDFFSTFYDRSLEKTYRPFREQAFEMLSLKEGASVLDIASGTGQNLPFLAPRVGSAGRVFALDTSPRMIQRATHRIEKARWNQVQTLVQDARLLNPKKLSALGAPPEGLDAVVCTLGLTVVPDWQRVLDQSFRLLRPGGQFLIMDVFSEKWCPMKPFVEWIAQADITRDVASELESRSAHFSRQAFKEASPWIFGGTLFVATGTRLE